MEGYRREVWPAKPLLVGPRRYGRMFVSGLSGGLRDLGRAVCYLAGVAVGCRPSIQNEGGFPPLSLFTLGGTEQGARKADRQVIGGNVAGLESSISGRSGRSVELCSLDKLLKAFRDAVKVGMQIADAF